MMQSMAIATSDECISEAVFIKKWIASRGIIWQQTGPMGLHALHTCNASTKSQRWQHQVLKPDWRINSPQLITK